MTDRLPYGAMTPQERRAYHTQKARESRARILADPKRAERAARMRKDADARYKEKRAALHRQNREVGERHRAERAAKARELYAKRKQERTT